MRRNPLDLVGAMLRYPLRRRVPILMYHHIRPAPAEDKLSVSPKSFARQMASLKRRGYRTVPVSDLVEEFDKGKLWRPRTVALTFDDGFRDFLEHASPVLGRLGFKATVFLITSRVGQEGYLDWDGVRELTRSGFDFGSHTVSHRDLVGLDDEALRREVRDSKERIQRETGREATLFSYPMGFFDERVCHAVKEAGYRAACVTNPPGLIADGDPFRLKRIKISPTSNRPWVFRGETSGYYQWFKEVRRKP